jgi:glycosyltransferase involved in cell wall biosynthesis
VKSPSQTEGPVLPLLGRAWAAVDRKVLRKLPPVLPDRKPERLIVFDDAFPNPVSAFRLAEFTHYLDHFPGSEVHTTGDLALSLTRFGSRSELLRWYAEAHPGSAGRVRPYRAYRRLNASLFYCVFLNNAHALVRQLERQGSGLVFTLYPGGGFGLEDPESDAKLRRVCGLPGLRKVIATQQVTYDYLIRNGFCAPDKVELIYGAVMPPESLAADAPGDRLADPAGHVHVCFAAARYTPRGADKGYDVFVDVARELARRHGNVRFHVVGNFTPADVDVCGLEDRLTFHGVLESAALRGQFRRMDLILSPNAPFRLGLGAFDGFPTGCCVEAGLRGVAVFCTDDLRLNGPFRDGEDLVIIPRDPLAICDILSGYLEEPARLRALGLRGAASFRQAFAAERQLGARTRILHEAMAVKPVARGEGLP